MIYRCGQPAQQQGLRLPADRFSSMILVRRSRVSSFLADSIQQIHSFLARGVMSCHVVRARDEEARAFRMSLGRVCTVPEGMSLFMQ
jgi:hypothetical protein